jgi:hypothetical protein
MKLDKKHLWIHEQTWLPQAILVLVSCPKGQVKKYVDVEAWQ